MTVLLTWYPRYLQTQLLDKHLTLQVMCAYIMSRGPVAGYTVPIAKRVYVLYTYCLYHVTVCMLYVGGYIAGSTREGYGYR